MGDQWVDVPLPKTTSDEGGFGTELTNMMAVPSPPGLEVPYILRHTPGINDAITAVGSGVMRGAIAHGDYLWWVRGTQLRRWDGTTVTLVGTVAGSELVQMVGAGVNEVFIVDGAGNEYVADAASVTAVAPPAGNFSDCTYMDGYTICIRAGTDEFYISDLDDPTTFGALSFSTADAISDRLVGCYVHNRELFLFGEKHTEVWVNTGASPFPFTRAVPGVIDKGCRAAGSIAHIGTTLLFQGWDFRVYRLDGYIPVHVSNSQIESNLLGQWNTANDVRASTIADRGVPCYVLSGSVGTSGYAWVYNVRDNAWHAQYHSDGGSAVIDYVDIVEFRFNTFVMAIAAVHSSSAANGFDPSLYAYSADHYQDQGSLAAVSRPCTVSMGKIRLAAGNHVFVHELELETRYVSGMTQAVALYLTGDGGTTLRNGDTVSGAGGSLRWHRNGRSREHEYRFEATSSGPSAWHRLRARVEVGL